MVGLFESCQAEQRRVSIEVNLASIFRVPAIPVIRPGVVDGASYDERRYQ
jgi:hypothetical protein